MIVFVCAGTDGSFYEEAEPCTENGSGNAEIGILMLYVDVK